MINLHSWQTQVARDVWRALFIDAKDSCVLQCPTGGGKTVMGAFLLKMMIDQFKFDATMFAHRREIVKQTAQKLSQAGIWPGVIMSGDVLSPSRPVQVCSIDSYAAWEKSKKIIPLRPKIIIVDECHRSQSPTYARVIKEMMDCGAKLLGLTATPIRSDGRGLAGQYQHMVCAPGVKELIQMGFLVPIDYKVGIVPDVQGVKLTAGDYDQFELQAVLDQKMLIGSVVENWAKFGRGRPTMGFATGVAHSMHLVEQFNAHGVRAVHIDGDTNSKVRDDANSDLMLGRIDMIFNANVYIEGTDIPPIACIIDAQPTKNVGRFLQKGGRGLRTCPGKRDLVYLDHAGNIHEHGRLEMKRDWVLCEDKENCENFAAERKRCQFERVCVTCRTSFLGLVCPACGDEYVRTGKEVDYLAAELATLTHEQAEKVQLVPSPVEKKRWFQEALGYAKKRGKSDTWAAHCYESKWKEGMPPREWRGLQARPSTQAVEKYMQSQLIRYAKGVAAAKNRGAMS